MNNEIRSLSVATAARTRRLTWRIWRNVEAGVAGGTTYPAELRKAKVEGRGHVLFVLDETGRVEDRASKFPRGQNLRSLRWMPSANGGFSPGMKDDGQPIADHIRIRCLPRNGRVSSRVRVPSHGGRTVKGGTQTSQIKIGRTVA